MVQNVPILLVFGVFEDNTFLLEGFELVVVVWIDVFLYSLQKIISNRVNHFQYL